MLRQGDLALGVGGCHRQVFEGMMQLAVRFPTAVLSGLNERVTGRRVNRFWSDDVAYSVPFPFLGSTT